MPSHQSSHIDSHVNIVQNMNPILADILSGKLGAVVQQHRASAATSSVSLPHPSVPFPLQPSHLLIPPFLLNPQQLQAASALSLIKPIHSTSAKPLPIKPIPIRLAPPPANIVAPHLIAPNFYSTAFNQPYLRAPDESNLLREKLKRKFETIGEDLSIAGTSQRQHQVDQLDFNPNSPFKPVQNGAAMQPPLAEMEKLKLGHVIDRIFMNAFIESNWTVANSNSEQQPNGTLAQIQKFRTF
jgi:hypothetical protein